MSFNILKNIENLESTSLITLLGPETYLRRQIRENLIKRCLDTGLKDLNYSSFVAGSDDITLALQACRDYPCFASKRVVWISELAKLRKSEGEDLVAYLLSPQDTTLLILEDEKLDGRLDWVKQLKKHSQIIETPLLSHEEQTQWLKKCLQDNDKKVDSEVLEKVVDWVGSSMDALKLAAEQLSLYVGDRDLVTLKDLDKLLVKVTEEDVFVVIDAMFSGKKAELARSLGALLDSGEAPLKVLALIYRHLSVLLALQSSRGKRSSSLLRMSPYVLRQYEGQVRRFGARLTPSLLGPMAQADVRLKSSPLPKDLLLKICVEEIGRLLG